jgi:tetratricopeptide (TPR) repeat protein
MDDDTQSQEIVDLARQAMERRDWMEACRHWEAALLCPGRSSADYVDATKAFREAARYDDAERTFSQGAQAFPEAESIAIAGGWLANARCDWPVAVSRWEDVQARFPNNPWGFLGCIHALRGSGLPEKIDSLLPALRSAVAMQRGLDPESRLKLEIEIAKARNDWREVQSSTRSMIDGGVYSAPVFLALAQSCWHLGDRDAADEAAIQAISLDPALSEAFVVRAWVATDRGDGEAALSCYRALAELNPGTVRWSLKVIQLLNRLGYVRDAVAELDRVRRRWPADPMMKVFLQNYGPAAGNGSYASASVATAADALPGRIEEDELLTIERKAPGLAEWRRLLIAPDGERDVVIAAVRNADTAVLVFTGSNDAVSMPLPLFDRYLAKLNITAVYLKDFKRLRFLTGIESLGGDYESTLLALRKTLDRLEIKRICTLGNCDGGFAAIRYGIELGAARIVAFGAPTHSSDDSLTKIEQARNFMKHRLAAKVPTAMMDLKPFLNSREHTSQLELFYEEEDARDSMQALHLAGLPGVRHHPQPGLSNHYLLRRIALKQEDFAGFLGDLLAVGTTTNR